jgi:hypothetical protein
VSVRKSERLANKVAAVASKTAPEPEYTEYFIESVDKQISSGAVCAETYFYCGYRRTLESEIE